MPDSVLHPFYDVRACADAVTFGDVFSVEVVEASEGEEEVDSQVLIS